MPVRKKNIVSAYVPCAELCLCRCQRLCNAAVVRWCSGALWLWMVVWLLACHTHNMLHCSSTKKMIHQGKVGVHTVLGYLIWKTPCYNKGRCRVFLVYVFSRVWKF
ncbi:hypothetical protein B0T22DRAFT_448359 [Podospora appendiculata]|uniref:Uncharacterized protein n=1 Tax=Podospora appendiculata TaxID=314037 RepID=A0AAE0XG86_9PEZI|nr:hypothetical protein B0T22DRAFT_448359 [Podospora appendiculata]